MNVLERMKCVTKTNYKDYYTNQSKEQLIRHKSSLKNQYLAPIIAWIIAFSIMLSANIDFELMMLFSGTVFATCFMLYNDYKKKDEFIREMIDRK